jgi:hypothetical protein
MPNPGVIVMPGTNLLLLLPAFVLIPLLSISMELILALELADFTCSIIPAAALDNGNKDRGCDKGGWDCDIDIADEKAGDGTDEEDCIPIPNVFGRYLGSSPLIERRRFSIATADAIASDKWASLNTVLPPPLPLPLPLLPLPLPLLLVILTSFRNWVEPDGDAFIATADAKVGFTSEEGAQFCSDAPAV